MEVIGCLVLELWSEKHHGHGTQLFEKTQCFTLLRVSVYYCVTRVLVKRQLESRQR